MSGGGLEASPPIILKDYNVCEKIGAGTYGTVYKAYKKSGPREVVAIKAILKKGLLKSEIDNVISEISMLKNLKHEYIVEMLDFLWDGNYIYIIMEYCGRGDLSKFIKTKKSLPESVVKIFLQQLGLALQFLHSKNISHMDLKPQNILISYKRTLKLADFGFAKRLQLSQKVMGIRGSPLYMAPEIVLNSRYDAKVDIWSVGVILFECLFGYAPYKSSSIPELFEKIKEDVPIILPPSGISTECRDLLTRCLDRHPRTRIGFQDFFNHPFLDLEHIPSTKSFAKASELAFLATEADKAGDFQSALKYYKECLEYYIPIIHDERDLSIKNQLRKRVDKYIIRAESLKEQQFSDLSKDSKPVPLPSNSHLSRDAEYFELLKSSSNTPNLKTSLEILNNAELYEREGKFKYALEQYEIGLSTILSVLFKEPKGPRRLLLNSKVNQWMSQAEKLKEVLKSQTAMFEALASTNVSPENTSDKNCFVQ